MIQIPESLQSILILVVIITISLKLVKLLDLILWSLGNLLKGHGLTNINWVRWIKKRLPKLSGWIERRKAHIIYRILDVLL